MKQRWLIILFLILAGPVWAGNYADLQPGSSTKEKVDSVLGQPVRTVIKGQRYDYDPSGHDAKRLSVTFDKDTRVLESINIFVDGTYTKDQFVEWLKLEGPVNKRYSEAGNLIEEYENTGIALHFKGPEESATVEFVRYFQSQQTAAPKQITQVTDRGPLSAGRPANNGKVAFLGVKVIQYDGQGIKVLSSVKGSPAETAGLAYGDIILQAGDYSFYQEGVPLIQFTNAIKDLAVNVPVTFVVLRNGQQFNVEIVLLEQTQEELSALYKKNEKKAKECFLKGNQALVKRDYMQAISLYKEAAGLSPDEMSYLKALGDVYSRLGDFNNASQAYGRIVMEKPEPDAYIKLGEVYAEVKQYDQAIEALERAKRLLNPQQEDVHMLEVLSLCYFEKGDVDEAAGYALKAYRLSNKKAATAAYYLGACYDKKGNARDAIYYYNRFLALNKTDEKREVLARSRLKALKNSPEYRQKQDQAHQDWLGTVGQIVDGWNKQGNPMPANYSQPENQAGNVDWDALFKAGQKDRSRYDSIFTLPNK